MSDPDVLTDDVNRFIATLRAGRFFESGSSVILTRSPGRLDVMGGIADYSGSLVLQYPIAEATFAAIQVIDEPVIEVISIGRRPYIMPIASLVPAGNPLSYEAARSRFPQNEEHHWAAYVVGVYVVLLRERGVSFFKGSRIVISSSIPEGKGVSSSAALETAAMQAVAAAFQIHMEPQAMALLCQKAENLVAGSPCGVMDQMTCVCGEKDSLLALLCRPAELQPPVRVPEDLSLWGIDSGERHAISGADYASVRIGAFMGYRIIAGAGNRWDGYLANISLEEFEREHLKRLPEEMSGAEFVSRYSRTPDTVTTIDPGRIYKIREPAAHPVYEHDRVQRFRRLLAEPPGEERRRELGDLMYQSHASYSACGLGSRGTDLIVSLVQSEGPANGLYGARITGGGSGGTVAVLGGCDAHDAINRVAQRYEEATGYRPYIFQRSSPGAAQFGWHAATI
jgi:L-arabinokinase